MADAPEDEPAPYGDVSLPPTPREREDAERVLREFVASRRRFLRRRAAWLPAVLCVVRLPTIARVVTWGWGMATAQRPTRDQAGAVFAEGLRRARRRRWGRLPADMAPEVPSEEARTVTVRRSDGQDFAWTLREHPSGPVIGPVRVTRLREGLHVAMVCHDGRQPRVCGAREPARRDGSR